MRAVVGVSETAFLLLGEAVVRAVFAVGVVFGVEGVVEVGVGDVHFVRADADDGTWRGRGLSLV